MVRGKRKRGPEVDIGERAAMVALHHVSNISLEELGSQFDRRKSTVQGVVEHAVKRQKVERGALGIDKWSDNKENLPPPVQERYIIDDYRSGRPERLTAADKQRLFDHATRNKAQRLKPWPLIAAECGFDIGKTTVYKYFDEAGYVRARPSHKPLLNQDQRDRRWAFADKLLRTVNLDIDLILCCDECKVTSGVQSTRLITRTAAELWHDDCITREIGQRTGLMFWGIIGKGFRGRCYIFDPESAEEKRNAAEQLKAEIMPEFERRMQRYKEDLIEYERLKALREAKGKEWRKIKTGRRPRMPRLLDFLTTRKKDIKGINWYRYRQEVVRPILKPEVDRFIEQKLLSLNNDGFRPLLIQDGTSAHEKAIRNGYFEQVNYVILDWPSNSPDLNPIKHI
jgi:hypothetical protein